MKRGTLIRLGLAAVIAGGAVADARAQFNPGSHQFNGGSSQFSAGSPFGLNSCGVHYALGAIALAVVAVVLGPKIFPTDAVPPPSPAFSPTPISPPPFTQISLPGGGGGGGAGFGGGKGGGGGAGGGGNAAPFRTGVNYPPAGETRFVLDEVLADTSLDMDAIAARHQMTCPETVRIRLTGHTLHRCLRLAGQSVPDMINALAGERIGSQPNYLYEALEDQPGSGNADQYAPEKLDVIEAHGLATGRGVAIAVIDSGVDPNHPDLAGAIAGTYDAASAEKPHPHGTGMAGAIASRGTVLGIAPGAELLTVRAFSANSGSAEGTTLNIIKGLDWAAEKGARVVNMSFAGPADPRLRDALAKANAKGMVLIAAAGNAGPTSPPLFPAADPGVIAVTAVDATDALFSGANRGKYIAVAAPGVDVLVPAPEASYQLTTGTSVAAAEVSGVVALLLERNPRLTPKDVRRILMRTAKHLGPRGSEREYGAGLVDALQAVTAAKSPGM